MILSYSKYPAAGLFAYIEGRGRSRFPPSRENKGSRLSGTQNWYAENTLRTRKLKK